VVQKNEPERILCAVPYESDQVFVCRKKVSEEQKISAKLYRAVTMKEVYIFLMDQGLDMEDDFIGDVVSILEE